MHAVAFAAQLLEYSVRFRKRRRPIALLKSPAQLSHAFCAKDFPAAAQCVCRLGQRFSVSPRERLRHRRDPLAHIRKKQINESREKTAACPSPFLAQTVEQLAVDQIIITRKSVGKSYGVRKSR